MLFHFIEYGEKTPQKILHRAVTAGKDPALRPDAVFLFPRIFIEQHKKNSMQKEQRAKEQIYWVFSERMSSYFSDRHEMRGVFRVLFAKSTSFTAKIPSRSDLEWDFRKLSYTPSLGRVR